ncbi:MAG: hypothetical protein P1V35_10080 [Planctomycetota bacterium]|nr:hypothetical protein [Planctomycetota bacterium]
MLRSTVLLVSLCSVALAQGPSFQPKPGSTWTRTHDLETNLKFDRITMEVNGRQSEGTDYQIEVRSKNHMTVEDAVIAWQPDGQRHLERAFLNVERDRTAPVKISIQGKTMSSETKAHGESPLLSQRVDFKSEAPGKIWLPSFADGSDQGLPNAWLDTLEVDLDYTMLLPKADMKAGTRWTVDAQAFLMAMDAGSSMPFDYGSDGGADLPLWIGGVADQPELSELWDSFENCRVQCKIMPQRKAGHLRLLEVQVTASFNGDADLVDWAMDSLGNQSSASSELNVNSASQSTVLTGSGVYLWDLDQRTMHSFQFKGTGQFNREQDLTALTGDEEMNIRLESEGQFDIKVSATATR